MYENKFDYRGFTITKTITKLGAVTFRCTIDGFVSIAPNAARIVAIIDQKLGQNYLNNTVKWVDSER